MNIENENISMHTDSDDTYMLLVFEPKKCCLQDVHCLVFTNLDQILRSSCCPNEIEYWSWFLFVHLQQEKTQTMQSTEINDFTYCESIAIITRTDVSGMCSPLLRTTSWPHLSFTESLLLDVMRRKNSYRAFFTDHCLFLVYASDQRIDYA